MTVVYVVMNPQRLLLNRRDSARCLARRKWTTRTKSQEVKAQFLKHCRGLWQKESGYGRRALVETAIGRHKAIIGSRLRARGLSKT